MLQFIEFGIQNVKTHNMTTQKAEKISNTVPIKIGGGGGGTEVLAKGKQFLLFIRHPPCSGVRYDFRIKTMFGSSLPLVVCRRAHVLFTLFMFACV
jgi:hypothetical protein